jgi:hypothetical protein
MYIYLHDHIYVFISLNHFDYIFWLSMIESGGTGRPMLQGFHTPNKRGLEGQGMVQSPRGLESDKSIADKKETERYNIYDLNLEFCWFEFWILLI